MNNDNSPQNIPRIQEEENDYFSYWSDDDFLDKFRLSKVSVRYIVKELGQRIIYWKDALGPERRVFLTLRYYATGSMSIACGDFRGISIATGCRIVKIVSNAIAALHSNFIKYPNHENGIRNMKQKFSSVGCFPMVIGVLDCTHVKIKLPGGYGAEAYRNKKNFFSINVQIICDSNFTFLDIDAKWPGSSHDSTIFDHSAIRKKLDKNHIKNCILIANGGYTQHKYIMTLITNPQTAIDSKSGVTEKTVAKYNEALTKTRNIVKTCYNNWKCRFPVLAIGINTKITSPKSIIVATAILHNIAYYFADSMPNVTPEIEESIAMTNFNNQSNSDGNTANSTRKLFLQYFNNFCEK